MVRSALVISLHRMRLVDIPVSFMIASIIVIIIIIIVSRRFKERLVINAMIRMYSKGFKQHRNYGGSTGSLDMWRKNAVEVKPIARTPEGDVNIFIEQTLLLFPIC